MKQNNIDMYLILLSFITLCIWYFKDLFFIYGFFIYFLIFIYLFIKQKPVYYFLIVILFSVMSMRNNTGIYKIEYLLTQLLFVHTLFRNITSKSIVLGNIFLASVVYLLYNMLSITWTPIKLDGWNGLIAMVLGYEIYYILTNGQFKINKSDLFTISKIATYIMLTLSIEIFYTYYKYGFEHVIARKSLVELGWGISNLIAVIYVLLIPIALYKYLDKTKYYLLYYLFDLISITGLILTLSRGAIVGVIASFILFAVFYIRRHFITHYLSIVLIIAYIVYTNNKLFYYVNWIKGRYIEDAVLDDNGRFSLYKLAIRMIKNKPLFGQGLKSSKYLIRRYLEAPNVHYHNFILQIMATLGVVGLVLFLNLVFKWSKVLSKPKDDFVMCCGIAIIGALTHQMVDVSFDLMYFGLYFYTILSIVEIYRHHLRDDELKMKILTK